MYGDWHGGMDGEMDLELESKAVESLQSEAWMDADMHIDMGHLTDVENQGYALIEYPTLDEAREAINGAHNTKLLDQTIEVDFAFVKPPPSKGRARAPAKGARRSRSRSPEGRDGEVE
jgi:RNA-binding protein 8A